MRIGVHTSIAGSLDLAAERAGVLGCQALQIFSTNPRQWKARNIVIAEAKGMLRLRERYDLHPLAIHTNYLINLSADAPPIRQRSIEAFRGEILRALTLEADYLITHPGSVKDGDRVPGLTAVVTGLEEAARGLKLNGLRILIENTAGGGGALCSDLAEIAAIIEHAGLPLGCCLDTAHSYQAGFDLSTGEGFGAWVSGVQQTVGWAAVKVIHTNDSRSALGSRHDRHEHIGKGGIGREGFRRLLNHPFLRDKVFILETPRDKKGDDRRNLSVLRKLREKHAGKAV